MITNKITSPQEIPKALDFVNALSIVLDYLEPRIKMLEDRKERIAANEKYDFLLFLKLSLRDDIANFICENRQDNGVNVNDL